MYLKLKTIFLVLLLLFLVSSLCFAASHDEWQRAWNDAVVHGQLNKQFRYIEGKRYYGEVDILTEDYAIEVDPVYEFAKGIGQALFYADISRRKPGLALYIDHPRDTKVKYEYAKKLANQYDIKVWLINDDVYLSKGTRSRWKFW